MVLGVKTKPARGRPRKPAAERTSARGVRLTEAEYKAVCAAAARAGLQFSEFVRRAVLAAVDGTE